MSLEGKSAAFSDIGICDVCNLELSVSLGQNHHLNPHDTFELFSPREILCKIRERAKTIDLQTGRSPKRIKPNL